jgi:hypothetical protein
MMIVSEDSSTHKISIGFALANCSNVPTDKVFEFIAEHWENAQLYTLRPGSGRKAAIDAFTVISLSDAGSITSIAGILWMAYDKFIQPRKNGVDDSAGIYISVNCADGTAVDVHFGKDVLDSDEFVRGFEVIVEEVSDPDLSESNQKIVDEVEDTGEWVKR